MESKTVKTLKAHLALNVKDVPKSIEFYRRMLGIEPCKVRAGYAKFDVEQPPLNLTLNERAAFERGAISHLGIQVASTADVLAVRERWRAAGLETFDEERTNCCYAIQDKTWVTDPDGNSWEAFVVLEDNLPETSVCCVSGAPDKTQAYSTCAPGTPSGANFIATVNDENATAAEESAAASCCGAAATNVSKAASCCEATAAPVALGH